MSGNVFSIQFTQSDYWFAIYENEPPGTEVGQVHAITKESDRLIYSIQWEPAAEIFEINPENGIILTKVSLDRESPIHKESLIYEEPEYHISVLATSEDLDGQISESVSLVIGREAQEVHFITLT